jgi:acyl-coenzyme A thioesterase PaaI-like protein
MTLHAFQPAPDRRIVHGAPPAAGPWSPGFCHGGAPAALAVRAAEAVPTLAPMETVRLTLELSRPVPVGELAVDATVLREGKKIQLVGVTIAAAGQTVATATVLKMRAAPIPIPADAAPPPQPLPAPEIAPPTTSALRTGFASLFEMRAARGSFAELGPAALWFNMTGEIVAGEPPSPAMRAAAASDFGNGISGVLDFTAWTYLNADLTVNLFRRPVGPWILVDSETLVGDHGRALTRTRLADAQGWCGSATQNLLIEPR